MNKVGWFCCWNGGKDSARDMLTQAAKTMGKI